MEEVSLHNLALAIQWREDVANGSGFISVHNYTRSFLGFERISQRELNAICEAVNTYYKLMNSNNRIGNRAGEIIPELLLPV